MKISSRHSNEKAGGLTDFRGGLDKSIPPFAIAQNALIDATNFYYDPMTGYLTTREGLKRYSASALPDSAEVIGVGEFIDSGSVITVLAGSNQKIYKLDSGLEPVLIGSLTGGERPSFLQMAGKLVICSGGVLQTWDGTTLSNTTSQAMRFISDYAQKSITRVIAIGTGDTVYLSGSNDPTNWATGTEADAHEFDAGYLDGLDVNGLGVFREYLFIFKKSIGATTKRIYRSNVNGESSTWWCKEFSKVAGILSPHLGKEIDTDYLFVDREGPKLISAVEGEIPFAINPVGNTIAGEISNFLAADGFIIYDPQKGIVMIKPSKNSDLFYCLDIIRGRWTYFKYELNIQCGKYINGKMLLGATDGYLYEYDKTLSQDNGLDYSRSVETKWFNLFEMYREMGKEKELDIIGLSDGALSLAIKSKGSQKYSENFEFSQNWWSWDVVNSITPEAWTELLTKEIYKTLTDTNRVEGDFMSFQINVTTGLCSLAQLRTRSAITGRN